MANASVSYVQLLPAFTVARLKGGRTAVDGRSAGVQSNVAARTVPSIGFLAGPPFAKQNQHV